MTARTRKEYMHPVYGLCVLIHPDPEDGALLIMERRGGGGDVDDGERPFYFGCESSDLYHVGERVTGKVEKWVGDAADANDAPVSEPADPLGKNVERRDRVFRWEPARGTTGQQFERALIAMDEGVRNLLRDVVRGGVVCLVGGQWRRVH